ncbi:hypothetical protein JKP88DRAFT_253856 [Tribonema minus]|uniref:Jacalin-type lectin domain-containing protein n=1 Tax=Tribonema minus TaxID=303371 RepID=A0A835ZF38_9STRA|nr:hypothetical protein JKP88DRAFT_253856 [Tribonema minus]
MKYYHTQLLHDGAGTVTVNTSDAASISHPNWNGKMTPIMAKAFFDCQASMPAQAPVLTDASSYTVQEGQVLAAVTIVETKKISVAKGKRAQHWGTLAAFTCPSPRQRHLRSIVGGSAWYYGTWNISDYCDGARVMTQRQIEDETKLVFYTSPGLAEHSMGSASVGGTEYDWHCLEPRMHFGLRSGGYVDAIILGTCVYGGIGGDHQDFTTSGVIESIDGTAGSVIDSLYFGTRDKDGVIITKRRGGSGGSSFCWGPPSVGRIYAVRVTAGTFKGHQVVTQLSILSDM